MCQRDPAVSAVFIDDGRKQRGEERVRFLELIFPVQQDSPVGAVATARRELADFSEHVLANGKVVTDGVLEVGRGEREICVMAWNTSHMHECGHSAHQWCHRMLVLCMCNYSYMCVFMCNYSYYIAEYYSLCTCIYMYMF